MWKTEVLYSENSREQKGRQDSQMSEQPIKGLVFDMDGLLFDSERVVQKSWNEVGRQMGFGERFGDHIYHTIGFNVVRREQYFKEHVSPDFPMEEFTENTRRIYHRIMEEDGVDRKPGAEELLKYAKEHGYRLALATSSRELHAQLLLKKYGLFDYFDGAVYGNMVSAGKPDPEIYLKACASIRVLPEFAIALEDAPSGIRSAAAAGMRPVMIPDLAEPSIRTVMQVFLIFMTILLISMGIYGFALQARYENPIKNTLKNALILTVAKMPYTLLMLVITVVPVVVTFLTVRTLMLGFLVWLLLGVSLIVWLNSLLLRRVFLVFEDIETPEKAEKI